MSARERFFKKVQQNTEIIPPGKKTAEAEIRAFCQRMDDLAQQITEWFAHSGIEVVLATKHIHDLSTIGFSLSSGICRYNITTIRLQNGERSVSIIPEQLCRDGEVGYVKMCVEACGICQVFYLSMAPKKGWFIRREHQDTKENILMTENLFFQAVDRLA
ncbi:hypothetical protein KI694_01280 [Enterobacter oligotrophicus]|uniref:hypothetical protein n=1 Tax=Enterobacter TaxID=547 RepID=UPI001C018999|nr:hypothetical protein [Enterobacter oligotrophicus]ELW1647269.1 hypothetical protein [Enterobacter oligotrophicus]MBT9424167.1 hypothetical protein [Enterobacter oligotrophicus]